MTPEREQEIREWIIRHDFVTGMMMIDLVDAIDVLREEIRKEKIRNEQLVKKIEGMR